MACLAGPSFHDVSTSDAFATRPNCEAASSTSAAQIDAAATAAAMARMIDAG